MANFAINGFGRIGSNVLRAMTQKQVQQVRAVNDLTDTHTLAHLLKWDSVHGKFDGEISYDDQNIIVRGHPIRILKERDPGALPVRYLCDQPRRMTVPATIRQQPTNITVGHADRRAA